MLYVLKSTQFYKVGFTENSNTLNKRINTYKTHNPDFQIIGLYEGTKEDEKKIHSLLSEHKHFGEWFNKNEYVEEIINNIDLYLIKDKILNLIGKSECSHFDDSEKEIYNYFVISMQGYIINFLIFSDSEMKVYVDKWGKHKITMCFNNLNIKTFYQDYSKKTNDRKFNGILFDSDYILLNIKTLIMIERLHKIYYNENTEIIDPETEVTCGLFTRKDFKFIYTNELQ